MPIGERDPKPDLDRLVFFSDGVFAIAITLLALDLRLPPHEGPMTASGLAQALVALLPRFLAFVVSFQVVGIFWLAHHRAFALIAGFNRGLAFLNLLFLMTIAFMPFPTVLVGEYGTLTTAAAFYGASLVAASLTSNVLWVYVLRRQLLAPHTTRADIRAVSARGVVSLAMFMASIPLAFVQPLFAELTWLSVALVMPLVERLARRPR